ncbi:toll/interleukin-1 receptor domain-containing protein [Mycobacterium riyadhense]|uniref:toll/interleukin-1 receptor domain-containing protein n=1 Tax=Mycobacterium riyadhense TaxID=486698 RepID=UPI001EFA029B|nr:toll/interleukin-1 receptor domain-containing protein [Mycobacterium riyadhense]
MPVPPILDVYVVWHPGDAAGEGIFRRLHDHFHSETYSGLAGGAVEVYGRSVGWQPRVSAPRPLLLPGVASDVARPAQFAAIIPVLGIALRDAVQADTDWADYISSCVAAAGVSTVVLPVLSADGVNLVGSALGQALSSVQRLPDDSASTAGLLERSVAQAVVQLAAGPGCRIKVFVSHAKHSSAGEDGLPAPPVFEQVRTAISNSKLAEFFDAHDLQPGSDWAADLKAEAGSSALLMVRTDRYASREWTQREVLVAKRHDVPIVALTALVDGEARGSFLMDHVPTVPFARDGSGASIEKALDRLADEALKRALWAAQSSYISAQGFDWLPVHAPEPVTTVEWLARHKAEDAQDEHLLIIHPDPPLGPDERAVVDEMCAVAGFDGRVDILTPRTFAMRGGEMSYGE